MPATMISRLALVCFGGLSVWMGCVIWINARLNAPQFMWMGVLFIILGVLTGLLALIERSAR